MEGKILRDSYLLWLKRQKHHYAEGRVGCDWNGGDTIVDWIFGPQDTSYYDIMDYIIHQPMATDAVVQRMWDRDKEYIQKITIASNSHQVISNSHKYFITITCAPDAKPVDLLKLVFFLRDKCKWVKSMRAVIENHRENGIILHTHMILEVDEAIKYGSSVKDKLYGLKMCKKLITGSNYIDYLGYRPEQHDKYIIGDKRESKMQFVEKDRVWRKENNIPDLIEKK